MKSEHKLAAIIVTWAVFAVLSVITLTQAGGSFLVMLILGSLAWITTSMILDADAPGDSKPATDSGKAKRAPTDTSAAALLELLDEDDIAELRQRVRHRLMDSIERGNDGELDALSSLLAEQEERLRRRR